MMFMKIYTMIGSYLSYLIGSDYEKSSKFFFKENDKVLGKFKDEAK